jgi:hypothetical protein
LDLSTQSLTALVISPASGVIQQLSIYFDQTYPHYGTRGGVPPSSDPLHVHPDPLMWKEDREAYARTAHIALISSFVTSILVGRIVLAEDAAPAQVIRLSAEATRIYQSPGGLSDVYAACERFALGLGFDPEEKIQAFRGAFPECQ